MLEQSQHHSVLLQRAWDKYGADAFVFEVLLYCDPENCLMYEQACLDYFKPEYNIALHAQAPMRGREHSQQTRCKMSQAHIGHIVRKNIRQKIREGQQGSLGNNAKLTEDDVITIRHRIMRGEKQVTLAGEFGVSAPTITDIKNRKSWRHL